MTDTPNPLPQARKKRLFQILAATLGVLLMFGCDHDRVTKTDDIQIKDVAPDVPQFKREYKVPINSDVSMTITIYRMDRILGLYRSGQLNQSWGKWVSFDPDDPADKILDRDILPIVRARIADIYKIDKQFRDADPSEFTDEGGDTWRKVKQ